MAERLTQEKVIMKTADLADDIGLHNLSFTKLGRYLGIAPPGVYRHVSSLEDLHQAISNLAAIEAASVISTASAGLSGSRALAALSLSLRDWAVQHPGRYAALQVAPDPNDSTGQAATQPILTAISSALRQYELAGEDLTDAIRIVRSTLHGFISLELNEGFKQSRDLEKTFTRLISFLDSALQNWES